MKGLLITCEGLDGAGKTTTIKQLLSYKKENKLVYSKGIGSDTFIGRLARKFPSTFMFMLELIYINNKVIKPSLKRNKIILQDRYDISILSYNPLKENSFNKFIAKILKPFIAKPDALVYFYVSLEERVKRLKNSLKNKYHYILVNNQNLIKIRDRKYEEFYNKFKGKKIKIDTTNKTAEQSSEILKDFIYNKSI